MNEFNGILYTNEKEPALATYTYGGTQWAQF